jgi:hypothetical protein
MVGFLFLYYQPETSEHLSKFRLCKGDMRYWVSIRIFKKISKLILLAVAKKIENSSGGRSVKVSTK